MIQLFVEPAMDDIIVIHRTSDSKLMVELAAVVEMMRIWYCHCCSCCCNHSPHALIANTIDNDMNRMNIFFRMLDIIVIIEPAIAELMYKYGGVGSVVE